MARFVSCDEELAILAELGLTMSESKVYLALVQLGPSRIRSVSKATAVCREHLYKTMRLLEGKGLIEKELGPVSNYKAVPLDSALSMLVEREQTHVSELEKKVHTILKERKKKKNLIAQAINNFNESSRFTIVHGREAIIRRLRNSLQSAQTNLDVVTTKERCSSALFEFAADYQKALARGVKIRIISEEYAIEKAVIELVNGLMKNSNFEFKYCTRQKTIVSIFDEKEAMVTLSATAHLEGASALWSNDSNFVDLVQNYFKTNWENSQEIVAPIKIMTSNKSKSALCV